LNHNPSATEYPKVLVNGVPPKAPSSVASMSGGHTQMGGGKGKYANGLISYF